jgi:site-specific DNA recombinase
LSNPIYIGEINHKGVRHPGQHPPLVSQATWEAAQAQLAVNRHANRVRSNAKSTNLLAGLLYDMSGNRLASSHTTKNGKRYRYYVTPELTGRAAVGLNQTKLRLPAAQIENLVISSLQRFMSDKPTLATRLRSYRCTAREISSALEAARQVADVLASNTLADKKATVRDLIAHVIVSNEGVQIRVRGNRLVATKQLQRVADDAAFSIEVLFAAAGRTGVTRLLLDEGAPYKPDPVVTKAVARAYRWFEDLNTGNAASMAEIAARENITDNYVSNLIHLAWLPPQQVELLLAGDPEASQAARRSMLTRAAAMLWDAVPVSEQCAPDR